MDSDKQKQTHASEPTTMTLRASLWISLLAGVVVLSEVFGGIFKLDSMIPPGFSTPRRTKIQLHSREPSTNATNGNTTTPSSLAQSSGNSDSRWRSSRNLTGSWIGDCWIPPSPEWRLYSAREMRDIFRGQRIAFVGDSLARRLGMMLFPILNHSTVGTTQQSNHHHHSLEEDIPRRWIDDPHDLALNKASRNQEPCNEYQWNGEHSPRICRTVVVDVVRAGNESGLLEPAAHARSTETTTTTPQPGQVWQIWDPCFPDLLDRFQKELHGTTNVTEGLDIVVVAAGIHDVQANTNCHNNTPWQPSSTNASYYYEELTQVLLERLDLVLQTLSQLQRAKPHLTIVWKTAGYSAVDGSAHEKEKLVDRINERAMDLLDQQQENATTAAAAGGGTTTGDARPRTILYFDWGGAVQARSFGDSRIQGDSINHYGVEARLVALQMLTNVLAAQPHFQPRREPL